MSYIVDVQLVFGEAVILMDLSPYSQKKGCLKPRGAHDHTDVIDDRQVSTIMVAGPLTFSTA